MKTKTQPKLKTMKLPNTETASMMTQNVKNRKWSSALKCIQSQGDL